ncbi:MAG: prolipoprotein diacylglyceryl transferase [Kineosporiaceae bacterium]
MTGPLAATALQAVLPSPTQGVWHLGPFPLRAYALCIIVGIVVAVRMGERRYVARGGEPGVVLDIAAWAVPFGIVGGRVYHVATSWQPYFGTDGEPVRALYIWEGGLGIWGAVALGAVGAYIGARRRGVLMPPLADALAPGILAAQSIGRWGNWFNNELYGRATDLPWGLRIYEWDQSAGEAVRGPDGAAVVLGTYHPTFLYEAVWSAAGVAVLLWADRRFTLGHGRVFALYIAVYSSGRLWIEALRIDSANKILGVRLNIWTSIVVLLVAVVAFVLATRRHPGRDRVVRRPTPGPDDAKADDAKSGPETGDAKADDAKADDAKVGPETDDAKAGPVAGDADGAPAGEADDAGTDDAQDEADVPAQETGDAPAGRTGPERR